MTAYAIVRIANIIMGVLVVGMFLYMDREALKLLKWRLLSDGEFLGKVGRVIYVSAVTHGTVIAVEQHKAAGSYLLEVLLGSLLLTVGAVKQTRDSLHQKKRKGSK